MYLFLSGCASLDEKLSIDKKTFKENTNNLQMGDIIITSKNWKRPISWFGHSAVMASKYKVGEYSGFRYDYYETDIILWLKKKKAFTALRYKHFDNKFKNIFLKNLNETKNKEYKITNKTDSSSFYCSQYIWYLFWKTAKDLNYNLDIDKNGGYFVTPYDLLNSNYFDKVEF
jgi:hypothetical protein